MVDTAITQTNPQTGLITAMDAFTALWDMLQSEDGTPFSVEANNLLLAIHQHYETTLGLQQETAAREELLLETLAAAREQRDAAVRAVETARKNGAKTAMSILISDIHYEFKVEPETAKTILDIIQGKDTDLPYYTVTTLRKAFELIDQELQEQYERDEQDAGIGDPEDDYDPR